MRLTTSYRTAIALACIWAIQLPRAVSQTAEPPTSSAPTFSTRSTLVLVPALVRDKAGKLIFTLTADDFTLTDDGIPQKLRLEQDTGGEPLALVVDIEGGGVGARELDKYRALAPMLESVIGAVPHQVAVVGFDSSPVLVQDFTPDIDKAASAVQALIADDSGDDKAAILDSIGFSVDLLRKQPPQYRRAILLLCETLDRGSQLKFEDAVRAISDTNTAIYSIGFSTGKSRGRARVYKDPGRPRSRPRRRMHGPRPRRRPRRPATTSRCRPTTASVCSRLRCAWPRSHSSPYAMACSSNVPETIAKLTGGEYFKLTDAKSLERDLHTISNHIPNRYILSFQPQSPHAGFHSLSLQAPGYKGVVVSARDGYWADTDAPPAPKTPIPQ